MRAMLDETCLSRPPSSCAADWECDTVDEEGLAGADDPTVAARCQAEARVLFTLDLDFADIRAYRPSEYVGIVVLRPVEPSRRQALELVSRVLPVLSAEWTEHRSQVVFASAARTSRRFDGPCNGRILNGCGVTQV